MVKNGTILKKLLRCRIPEQHSVKFCQIALINVQANVWHSIPQLSSAHISNSSLSRDAKNQMSVSDDSPFGEEPFFASSPMFDDYDDRGSKAFADFNHKFRFGNNKESIGYNASTIVGSPGSKLSGGDSPVHNGGGRSVVNLTEKCYMELDNIVSRKHEVFHRIMSIFDHSKQDHERENIDVVFSQYALPFRLHDLLTKSGVTVVFPLSLEEINLLSMALNCQICTEEVLATQKISIGSLYTTSVPNFLCFENKDKEDRTESHILVIDKEVREKNYKSLGMFVYSQNLSNNCFFAEFLRHNLAYIYYTILEKSLMDNEAKLYDAARAPNLEKLDRQQVGDFRSPLSESMANIKTILSPVFGVRTTKVTLVRLNMQNAYKDLDKDFHVKCDKFAEIVKRDEIFDKLEQKQEFDHFDKLSSTDLAVFANLNMTKVDFIAVMASDPVVASIEIYSQSDKTLGIFLRNRFKILDTICSQTGMKVKEHVTLIYIGEVCIKVSADDFEGELDYPHMRGKLRKGKMLSNVNFNRAIWIEKFKRMNEAKHDLKPVNSKKQKQKSNYISRNAERSTADLKIRCCLVCDICHSQLSHEFKVNKDYKNISFLAFLLNMATKRKLKKLLTSKSRMQSFLYESFVESTCNHPVQARAFIHGNKVIKFTRMEVRPFSLQVLDFFELNEGSSSSIFQREFQTSKQERAKEVSDQYLRFLKYYRSQMLFVWYLIREVLMRVINYSGLEAQNTESDRTEANAKANRLGYKRLRLVYFKVYGYLLKTVDLIWICTQLAQKGGEAFESQAFLLSLRSVFRKPLPK